VEQITDSRELALKANDIRADIIKMLAEAGSGHSAGPLGLADVFACLYFNVLNLRPKEPKWPERDRFVLSNGHCAPVMYAAMAEKGFLPKEELMTLRKLGSRLQGHVDRVYLPGLENTNASLGQGLGISAGMAYAAKLDGKKHSVYCGLGDGECEEGSVWEAAMFAAHYKLDNLIAYVDFNNIQIDGFVSDVMAIEPFAEKWRSFGWNVIEEKGNDIPSILKAFEWAGKNRGSGKPSMILFKTIPGKGVSFMEGKYEWHGKPPSKEEAEIALKELAEARAKI
jgi:transketolase